MKSAAKKNIKANIIESTNCVIP